MADITNVVDMMQDLQQALSIDLDVLTNEWLHGERKIYTDSELDDSSLSIQRQILRWNIEDAGVPVEKRKPIWIYIYNYGGDLPVMWSLVDAVMASKTPVYTVDVGLASSAAAILFMSGHKRFMFKNASVLIHEGSAEISGDAQKVLDMNEAYKKQLARMKKFILEHTNIPKSQLYRKRSNDWEIDSEFCLNNGVCDVVVESLDEII